MSDTDPELEEEKIVAALKDERWDYRTVSGVARATGLDEQVVCTFLETRKDLVWKSAIPDRNGRDLYTIQGRQAQSKDFWRNLRTFLTKLSS